MDQVTATLEVEVKTLREQLKLKEKYIRSLEYAFAEIEDLVKCYVKPLDEAKGGDDAKTNTKTNGFHN